MVNLCFFRICCCIWIAIISLSCLGFKLKSLFQGGGGCISGLILIPCYCKLLTLHFFCDFFFVHNAVGYPSDMNFTPLQISDSQNTHFSLDIYVLTTLIISWFMVDFLVWSTWRGWQKPYFTSFLCLQLNFI